MQTLLSYCKENHYGKRPGTWKQGNKETQETEAGCCSDELDHPPIQSSQAYQTPKLIVGGIRENATVEVAFSYLEFHAASGAGTLRAL